MEVLLTQEGMRLQGELGSGVLWSKDDVYAQVFGLERPGRVRGVGFGITPSGRSATNLSQFTSTPSSSSRTTQRILELQTSLREQLAQVQEQLSQVEARHQQQMAKVMTSMREMFAQLSLCMCDLDTSQGGNA